VTYPFDYGQQLLAHLQAWRQFLEPMAATTPGNPYQAASWGMAMPPMPPPFTPPMPASQPVAPAPTDYVQQLLACLQAWRENLERMTGATPAPSTAQGSTVAPPSYQEPHDDGSAGGSRPTGRPRVPIPPDSDVVGRSSVDSLYAGEGESSSPWPPPNVALAPRNEGGTQLPRDLAAAPWRREFDRSTGGETGNAAAVSRQAAQRARGPQELRLPTYEAGNMYDQGPHASGRDAVGRTFATERAAGPVTQRTAGPGRGDATGAVRSGAGVRPVVRSLYGLQ
jgi:hypothetical protein